MIMMRHEFVEYIPEKLEEGVLYISIPYVTAVHNCACGCGEETVTPISPAGWKLIFDGESISLYPSIGNWSIPCKSHYWIRDGRVTWAEKWSSDEIQIGREQDNLRLSQHYSTKTSVDPQAVSSAEEELTIRTPSWWERFLTWIGIK
jgi:Family of unknown function (DUF6527)